MCPWCVWISQCIQYMLFSFKRTSDYGHNCPCPKFTSLYIWNSVVLCWRDVNSHNTLNLMDSSPNASAALSQQRKRKQAFISTICKCTLKHIFMCCLLALVVHPVFFCLLAFLFIVLTVVNCIFIQFSWVYCCSLWCWHNCWMEWWFWWTC